MAAILSSNVRHLCQKLDNTHTYMPQTPESITSQLAHEVVLTFDWGRCDVKTSQDVSTTSIRRHVPAIVYIPGEWSIYPYTAVQALVLLSHKYLSRAIISGACAHLTSPRPTSLVKIGHVFQAMSCLNRLWLCSPNPYTLSDGRFAVSWRNWSANNSPYGDISKLKKIYAYAMIEKRTIKKYNKWVVVVFLSNYSTYLDFFYQTN